MLNRIYWAFFAMAAVVASAEICFARLGETEAELDARYGDPAAVQTPPDVLPPAEKQKLWILDGPQNTAMVVMALIHNGRCVRECHSFRTDGKAMPLKNFPAEVKSLLEANATGGKWEDGRPDFIQPNFAMQLMRSDGKAFAYAWKNDPNVLVIDDIKFVRESIAAGAQGR